MLCYLSLHATAQSVMGMCDCGIQETSGQDAAHASEHLASSAVPACWEIVSAAAATAYPVPLPQHVCNASWAADDLCMAPGDLFNRWHIVPIRCNGIGQRAVCGALYRKVSAKALEAGPADSEFAAACRTMMMEHHVGRFASCKSLHRSMIISLSCPSLPAIPDY